jgi:hypothetical protein
MNMKEYTRGNISGSIATESERPIAQTMTQLASQVGDLETALRALAGRISPLLPAGSPFDRPQRETATANAVPQPVRSHLCDELHSRVYQLRELTGSINEMVKSVEL